MNNIESTFSRIQGDMYSNQVFNYKILPLSDLSDKTKRDNKHLDNTGYLTIGNVITVNTGDNQIKRGLITRVGRDVNGTPLIVYFKSDDDNKIYSVHALNAEDEDQQIAGYDNAASMAPINQTSIDSNVSTLVSNLPIFEVLSPSEFKGKLFEDADTDTETSDISYKNLSFEFYTSSVLELDEEVLNSITDKLDCEVNDLVFLNQNKPDFDKFLKSLKNEDDVYLDKDGKKYVIYSKDDIQNIFTEYVEDMTLLQDI